MELSESWFIHSFVWSVDMKSTEGTPGLEGMVQNGEDEEME